MKLPAINPIYAMAGAAIVAALVYVKAKGATGAGQQLGGAAVDLVNGVVTGAVVSGGQLIGIPATSMKACERAKAEGRTWDASFDCPAKDFLQYVWS